MVNLELLKLFSLINFPYRGFKELKPGKLILNTGFGGTFFAKYDKWKFYFLKLIIH